MDFDNYFQSYENYFWQWEEGTDVIAIPGSSTIAYKPLIIEIFEKTAHQGMPPFGAVLLALIGTNPKSEENLNHIYGSLTQLNPAIDKEIIYAAFDFLKLLNKVPEHFKAGNNRVLLLQAIFNNAHNRLSDKTSLHFINQLKHSKNDFPYITAKVPFNIATFQRDFRTIGLLNKRFSSVESILAKIASLPDAPEMPDFFEEKNSGKNVPLDFVEELTENPKTFHVGSLIKRIWSGLHIPVHSSLPSAQPLGGISDLTTKGDFDKLLISEFANDDIMLMSRLANNEALYINREIPPVTNNMERILLVDVSLKSWGTPKTVAYAVALAIARHPKTNIPCKMLAIGDEYTEVIYESVEQLIAGLQVLDGSLSAEKGLESFFKNYPSLKNREIFFITEESSLKNGNLLRCLDEHASEINYLIHTDANGSVDVYHKLQRGKKHLGHMQLPLEETWKKAPREISKIVPVAGESHYPILFRNPGRNRITLPLPNGEIYAITSNRRLIRLFNPNVEMHGKGWELLREKLPPSCNFFEAGLLTNKEVMLLMFNSQKKEIHLLNLANGDEKIILFTDWVFNHSQSFIFSSGVFLHNNPKGTWSIHPDGKIGQSVSAGAVSELYVSRQIEIAQAGRNLPGSESILRNIREVYINETGNLVFNVHELRFSNHGYHIMLLTAQNKTRSVKATRANDTFFTFPDGSSVTVNTCGMVILRSSVPGVEPVYVPTALNTSLGLATDSHFTGNEYYRKNKLYNAMLVNAGPNKLAIVKLIKENTNKGLQESKEIIDAENQFILQGCDYKKAAALKKALEAEGATVAIHPIEETNRNLPDQNSLSTQFFFEHHIRSFTKHIVSHGAAN